MVSAQGDPARSTLPFRGRFSGTPLVTDESVYGTILVSGMVVASGGHDATSWETFLRVVGTVLVFWCAHVYAGTVAGHNESAKDGATLGSAFRESFHRSLGFIISAALPCLVLLLGALRVVPDGIALWLGVVILGFLGYSAFARRGEAPGLSVFSVAWCLQGASGGAVARTHPGRSGAQPDRAEGDQGWLAPVFALLLPAFSSCRPPTTSCRHGDEPRWFSVRATPAAIESTALHLRTRHHPLR